MMDAWMPFQPGARLQTVVTGEIIADDEEVTCRIVGFDVGQQSNVALGVTRSGTAGHLLAIAHAERPVDPGCLGPALIVQRRFDAVPCDRPAWGRIKGAGHYRSEFVGADGRRALWWLGVVADDRGPFGTKSLSRGVPQLCVCRHRTPSLRRMRRIWLRFTRMPVSLAACASASKLH